MTHEELLANLDHYDLQNVIELANKKLKVLQDAEKEEYYVVSDEWMNLGFFRKDNLEGAIACMAEEARKGIVKDKGDRLTLDIQRWYKDEVEGIVK